MTRKTSKVLLFLSLALVLFQAGCSTQKTTSEEKSTTATTPYEVKSDGVYYHDEKVEGADPGSFKGLNEFYGKDKLNAYYQGKKVEYLDAASLEAIDLVTVKDKNDVYDSFGNPKDIKNPASFHMIGKAYAKDDESIYFVSSGVERVGAADYNSFQELEGSEGYFGKDNQHVFKRGEEIKGADPATFQVTGFNAGKDKNFIYDGLEKKPNSQ